MCKQPHKWAKEIKAWADGAQIQRIDKSILYIWTDCPNPVWNTHDDIEYRIKPELLAVKGYIIVRKSGFYPNVFTSLKAANAWGKPLCDFVKIIEITELIEV